MNSKLTDAIRNRDGAASVEYAILASLIAAVVVATVSILGEKTIAMFASFNF